MKNNPKISIILPSYNYENFITKAIDSIITQSYTNWELIIVDDGSSDNSLKIINKYAEAHENIRVFTHDNNQNKGLQETILLGLEKVSGEYVTFLECDDFWDKNCLEIRVESIKQNPNVGLFFNDIKMVGDENTIQSFSKYKKAQEKIISKIKWPQKPIAPFILMNLIPTFSCVIFKKDILKKCNFNTPLDPLLDYWIYLQVITHSNIFYINKPLTYWYKHPNSYIEKTDLCDGIGFKKALLESTEKNYKLNIKEKIFIKIALNKKLEKIFRNLLVQIAPFVI